MNNYSQVLDDVAEEYNGIAQPKEIDIPEGLLWGFYWGKCYTQKEIAELFGCDSTTIHNRMKEYGIPIYKGYKGDIDFSDIQWQIFEGCMLGDGSIKKIGFNDYPYFQYVDKHHEYHKFIQDVFGIEGISTISFDGKIYMLRTRRLKELKEEYSRWYPGYYGNGVESSYKIIPHDLELTPVSMLFWYIGDGTYCGKWGSVYFTNYLNKDDAKFLQKEIKRVLDISKGVTVPLKYADRGIYNIYLNKQAASKFFELVKETGFDVPECYWYKFGIGE